LVVLSVDHGALALVAPCNVEAQKVDQVAVAIAHGATHVATVCIRESE